MFKAAWLKGQDPWRRGVVSGRRGVQGWGGGTVVSVMERRWGFRPRSPYIGLLALWVGHSSVCEVGEAD